MSSGNVNPRSNCSVSRLNALRKMCSCFLLLLGNSDTPRLAAKIPCLSRFLVPRPLHSCSSVYTHKLQSYQICSHLYPSASECISRFPVCVRKTSTSAFSSPFHYPADLSGGSPARSTSSIYCNSSPTLKSFHAKVKFCANKSLSIAIE